MQNHRSPYGTVVQFMGILKIAARLSEKPAYARTISNDLAINERTFYRRVRDLNELGIEVKVEHGIWYIEKVDDKIKNLFETISNNHLGINKKNERVRAIKQRWVSANT